MNNLNNAIRDVHNRSSAFFSLTKLETPLHRIDLKTHEYADMLRRERFAPIAN